MQRGEKRWKFGLSALFVLMTAVCVATAVIRTYPALGELLLSVATFLGMWVLIVLAAFWTLIVVYAGIAALNRFDRWRNPELPATVKTECRESDVE